MSSEIKQSARAPSTSASRRKYTAGRVAVAYVRVSTDEQARRGYGMEAQRNAIQKYADTHGIYITEWFGDDGATGSAVHDEASDVETMSGREGLAAAIKSLREGWILLVAKRDRLARSAMLSLLIERDVRRKRANIVSVAGEGSSYDEADDPYAKAMRGFVDIFSELELDMIRARTRAALRVKRERGERISLRPPYGWRVAEDGKMLEPVLHEQNAIRQAVTNWRNGASLTENIAMLARQGYINRKGRPFHKSFVWTLIKRYQECEEWVRQRLANGEEEGAAAEKAVQAADGCDECDEQVIANEQVMEQESDHAMP